MTVGGAPPQGPLAYYGNHAQSEPTPITYSKSGVYEHFVHEDVKLCLDRCPR